MIIDIHTHNIEFSKCGKSSLEEMVKKAEQIGLDAICITDHDNNLAKNHVKELSYKYNIKIFVGVEIFTYEGDILVFGLDDIPEKKMYAQELVDLVNKIGGVTIAAHPYRDNGRGIGGKIESLSGLTGVEVYNGNTKIINNKRAFKLADKLGLPMLGGSDSHHTKEVGFYATKFPNGITDIRGIISAIKQNNVKPVQHNLINNTYEYLK